MLDQRRRQLLDSMGIDYWVQRGASDGAAAASHAVMADPDQPTAAASAGAPVIELDWPELEARVAGCTACALHESRTRTVFGVGQQQARLLVIGEAPGAEEDRRGEPFVGRAGQLLNAMLAAIGLRREAVYIANILKCRPPRNRDPAAEEVIACRDYLARQIALLEPEVILAVGRVAAQNLLQVDTPIGRMRGQSYVYASTSIPVVVTYHPAYLLRSPGEKRKAWSDLQVVQQMLAGAAS